MGSGQQGQRALLLSARLRLLHNAQAYAGVPPLPIAYCPLPQLGFGPSNQSFSKVSLPSLT